MTDENNDQLDDTSVDLDATQDAVQDDTVSAELADSQQAFNTRTAPTQDEYNALYFQLKQAERDRDAANTKMDTAKEDFANTIPEPGEDKTPEDFDFDDDAFNLYKMKKEIQSEISTALTKQAEQTKINAAKQENDVLISNFNEKAVKYAAKNAGYEKAIDAAGGTVRYARHIEDVVFNSEVGPELDHMLLTNPQLVNKLHNLSPLQATLELGRLESTVKTENKPVKVSNAPEPFDTGGGGASVVDDFRTDPNVSMSDYMKQFDALMAKKANGN